MCEYVPFVKMGTRKKRSSKSYGNETTFLTVPNEAIRLKRQAEESEDEILQRSYGSNLGYECGLARRFQDPETEELYPDRWMTCNWNKTWTPVDTLDDCVWIQCINPPLVSNLVSITMIASVSASRRFSACSELGWSSSGV